MAQLIFRDAYVYITNVDLSSYVKSVTINYGAAMQDDTVMGDTTKSNASGLFEWSITVEFVQDYGASLVDATLFPLVGAAAFTVTIRPVKGTAVGATNPNFIGSAVLASYNPASGTVGDLHKCTATFQSASTLARNTT
ncbi:MAG: radical SAM protein [Pseudomonadota bacterium]